MNEYFEGIMRGLEEAAADASGKQGLLKRNRISVVPVKKYGPDDIKEIRRASGLSQRNFASYMGVSVKTVEAWESGVNTPSGTASRLLSIMEMEKDFMTRYPFICIT